MLIDSWQASFEECLSGAQSSFTEAPGAVVDSSVTPDPASLDEFEAALNQNQRRSGSVKSTRDKQEALARRAITTQPTCNQVYVNFGTDNHYR